MDKKLGQYFTKKSIVRFMLDDVNYNRKYVLKKHVIDPSCGDGAFLCEIVDRYCDLFVEEIGGFDKNDQLKRDLETFIHGVEIDEKLKNKCVENLNKVAERYQVYDVNWDIINEDFCSVRKYDGKMDFVFGNPPYVRVHNLDACKRDLLNKLGLKGSVDLFQAFYLLGINLLNKTGMLCYINPSSLNTSASCSPIRKKIIDKDLLLRVYNLGDKAEFNAQVYTSVYVLSKERSMGTVYYYDYSDCGADRYGFYFNKKRLFAYSSHLFYMNDKFYFNVKQNAYTLRSVFNAKHKAPFIVSNGFATLADSVFISDNEFPFKDFVIPVVKASTNETKYCFFPYRKNSKGKYELVDYEEIIKNKDVCDYLGKNEDVLKRRSIKNKDQWYGFGRSQGIAHVDAIKLSIGNIVKDSVKTSTCKRGVGVYGGLFVQSPINVSYFDKALKSDDFLEYVAMIGNLKQGGYYSFGSKELSAYFDWYFERYGLLKF